MTTANFDRVKASVESSTVPESDKKFLMDVFAEVSDDCLADIAKLFEEKGNWVEKFNENRSAKLKAFSSGDTAEFQKIIDQEKKYIDDLTYGLD